MKIAIRALMTLAVMPLCVFAEMAMALPLQFPANARLQREDVTPLGRYDLPTAAMTDGYLPTTFAEGEVTEQVWRVDAPGLSTLQLLSPLRAQLVAAGFDILLDCDTEDCGGFDFRAATRVLPPPEMHVDLGDFRFLSARRDDEVTSLLVSRTSGTGFIQMIRVGQPVTDGPLASSGGEPIRSNIPDMNSAATINAAVPDASLPADFGTALDQAGRVVLSDLAFQTGSAQLAEGRYASLQSLADYLNDHPDRRVALVGHTDSQGSLDVNIALSRRRAGSVLERLVSDYDIPRQQLEAEGMGYLSPVASNLTAEGREANRRVEVIVTSTE